MKKMLMKKNNKFNKKCKMKIMNLKIKIKLNKKKLLTLITIMKVIFYFSLLCFQKNHLFYLNSNICLKN